MTITEEVFTEVVSIIEDVPTVTGEEVSMEETLMETITDVMARMEE